MKLVSVIGPPGTVGPRLLPTSLRDCWALNKMYAMVKLPKGGYKAIIQDPF